MMTAVLMVEWKETLKAERKVVKKAD